MNTPKPPAHSRRLSPLRSAFVFAAALLGLAPGLRAAAVTPILKDNADGVGITITGSWTPSTYWTGKYEGTGYLSDGNAGKGSKSVRFTPTIPTTGTYGVMARWVADSSGSTSVPITITHAGGTANLTGNQYSSGSTGTGYWYYLGNYTFNAGTGGNVLISNTGTTGVVYADAVRFVRPIDLTGYPLTFSEEFSTAIAPNTHIQSPPSAYDWTVKPSKWFGHIPTNPTGYGDAWFNVTTPFSVASGILSIKAWYNPAQSHWISGTLASVNPAGEGFAQRYGYFVARMKFPSGMGHFPAFWMLTKGDMQTPATTNSELDVVENYGGWPTVSHHTSILHTTPKVTTVTQAVFGDLSAAYHDYGILVEPDLISWFIDGILIKQTPTYTEARHPFYLLVTYALGSGWPLTGVSDPSYTYVDYVRAYALPAALNAGQDVGSVGVAGSDSCAANVHTVVASGADIYGSADSFRFVNHRISGDVTLIARVASLGNTHAHAKAGLMFRESTAADSKHAAVYVKPTGGGGTAFERRTATAGGTASTSGTGAPALWLRLVRAGDVFTASTSSNGTTWTQLGTSQTVAMTRDLYVGFAVTSHNNADTTTATFDNVSLVTGLEPQDIGAPSTPGTYAFDGTTHTLTARGTDFWNDKDHGHIAVRELIGDGSITARVTGLTNTDVWAKAGVMMRASIDEKAPNAFMLIPAAAQASFQRRTTMAGATGSTTGASVAPPYWVRLVRSGDSFSGFISSNGTTWTQVGTAQTIAMPKSIHVGLAATSHNNASTATATFTHVTITGL